MSDPSVPFNRRADSTSLSLLEKVQHKDQAAWESFVILYAPLIYSRCRQHWGLLPPDAENIGQEVFAVVARKIAEFERKRKGSFRAWLRAIVDNKCIDLFRKEGNAKGAGGSAAAEMLNNLPGETKVSTESTAPNEKALLIQQAMKKIEGEFSARDLKIFWQVAVEHKHRQTVAEVMDVSDNVVYLAYSRIRKRLREIYMDLIDDEDYGSEIENST